MKKALALAALLVLTATSNAQEVSFVGKVEDVSGTTNQFFVDCTNAQLTSAINLNPFNGEVVSITGTWNGSVNNPSVNVETIALAAETFEIGGGAKIGDTSNLGFTGQPGDNVVGFLATGSTFLPTIDQVIMIDPTKIRVTLAGTIGGSGILEMQFPIPNNPSLIGFEIFGQGAFVADDGTVTLTNPDCKEISD